MDENEVKVGSLVRFFSSRALGKVLEIDTGIQVARVKLLDGTDSECWQNLDLLEVVKLEESQRRIAYRNVGAE